MCFSDVAKPTFKALATVSYGHRIVLKVRHVLESQRDVAGPPGICGG